MGGTNFLVFSSLLALAVGPACGGAANGKRRTVYDAIDGYSVYTANTSANLEQTENGVPVVVAGDRAECRLVAPFADITLGNPNQFYRLESYKSRHKVKCPEGRAVLMTEDGGNGVAMACEQELWQGGRKSCGDRFQKVLAALENL